MIIWLPPDQIPIKHYLDFGHDGDDGEGDADEHVEADEELVQLALAGEVPGVVEEHEHHGRHRARVHQPRAGQQRAQPAPAVSLLDTGRKNLSNYWPWFLCNRAVNEHSAKFSYSRPFSIVS